MPQGNTDETRGAGAWGCKLQGQVFSPVVWVAQADLPQTLAF